MEGSTLGRRQYSPSRASYKERRQLLRPKKEKSAGGRIKRILVEGLSEKEGALKRGRRSRVDECCGRMGPES